MVLGLLKHLAAFRRAGELREEPRLFYLGQGIELLQHVFAALGETGTSMASLFWRCQASD
ncbi:hypothetical protein [Sinorhizobium meliloti]|uniref:hypothetical protein n=1 Tax=Rhizobium meliloti TaxID=382 RepID=UPI001AECFD9E|nr:hypothetical protein [Sinorhizobium meliloti]